MITLEGSQFCVYIMTNEQHSLLYTGRTGNLKRRVAQHRSGNGGVFTHRYNLIKLVYYEAVEDNGAARLREKQIKRSSKKQRLSLIERMNPEWSDLYSQVWRKKIYSLTMINNLDYSFTGVNYFSVSLCGQYLAWWSKSYETRPFYPSTRIIRR